MRDSIVRNFIYESNRIESIIRIPSMDEINEFRRFIVRENVSIGDLTNFVSIYQPGAVLRLLDNQNVRIGNHIPPPGGSNIGYALEELLEKVNNERISPFEAHCAYEALHPFTDGNGRSGRMLWAWQMNMDHGENGLELGFLHRFYYQALDNFDNI